MILDPPHPVRPLGYKRLRLRRRLIQTIRCFPSNVRLIRHLLKRVRQPPHTLVFLYAREKTASTSMEQALKEHYPSAFLRLHHISSYGSANILQLTLLLWMRLKPSLIITPLRNPWEQSMSTFMTYGGHYGRLPNLQETHVPIDAIIARYFRALPMIIAETDTWFDTSIKKNLSIDVFASPFPTEKGVNVYSHHRKKLLVLQTELPNTEKDHALATFIGIPNLTLPHANIGIDNPNHGKAYHQFKKTIRFTPQQADLVCSSRYFRHFYSPAFIEESRARWLA
ncbi:MAG: hypothetical protein GDA50_00985 [Alphaproteobacteria bacterium GM202ARS2]|nr:hypothetical protein [Alphaproteobacteria bacterium GM202ARS2]